MKRRVLGFLLVTALLFGVGTITAACGGGEAELTLDEYFQKLETVSDDLEQRGEALGTELEEDIDLETGELPSIETLRRLLSEGVSASQDALDETERLDPPPDVKSAHNEFVEAARGRVEFIESVVDEVVESESVSDLLEIFTQVSLGSEQETRFEDACRALEQIAVDNGIQADLNCQ